MENFSSFLQMYLNNFNDKIIVECCECPQIEYINNCNHIKSNKQGIKIMIPINKYELHVIHKNIKYCINNTDKIIKFIGQYLGKHNNVENGIITYFSYDETFVYNIEIYSNIAYYLKGLVACDVELGDVATTITLVNNIDILKFMNEYYLIQI
jgi:hypothetical protein